MQVVSREDLNGDQVCVSSDTKERSIITHCDPRYMGAVVAADDPAGAVGSSASAVLAGGAVGADRGGRAAGSGEAGFSRDARAGKEGMRGVGSRIEHGDRLAGSRAPEAVGDVGANQRNARVERRLDHSLLFQVAHAGVLQQMCEPDLVDHQAHEGSASVGIGVGEAPVREPSQQAPLRGLDCVLLGGALRRRQLALHGEGNREPHDHAHFAAAGHLTRTSQARGAWSALDELRDEVGGREVQAVHRAVAVHVGPFRGARRILRLPAAHEVREKVADAEIPAVRGAVVVEVAVAGVPVAVLVRVAARRTRVGDLHAVVDAVRDPVTVAVAGQTAG